MAIKLKSWATMSNLGTSLDMPAFEDVATDDFILVFVGKDDSAGTWAESGSSDYTKWSGSIGGAGSVNTSVFYRKATSGSETPRTFDSTDSDDCAGFVTVWSGVDTTTPLDDSQGDTTSGASANLTTSTMTTTVDNAVLAWFATSDGGRGLGMPTGLMGLNPQPYASAANNGAGVTVIAGWTAQESSGTTINPSFPLQSNETGQVSGFALRPASSTDGPPRVDYDNPPTTVVHPLKNNLFGSGAYTSTGTFDPTGTVTDVDGETTTYSALLTSPGAGPGLIVDSCAIRFLSSALGLYIAGFDIDNVDLSGEKIVIHLGCQYESRKFASIEDKGMIFGLRSGTSDYMFWSVGGVNSQPTVTTEAQACIVDIDGGYEIDEIGTFDSTDISGVIYGGNRLVAANNIYISLTEFHTLGRVVIIGGSSDDPCTSSTFTDAVKSNYVRTVPTNGIAKQPVSIGDGSTATYFKDDSAFFGAYSAGTLDYTQQCDASYASDLEIYASANCTIDLTGQVWKGTGSTPFAINASSSASADYVFGGLTLIERAVTFRDVFTAASGITLSNCTYTSNNADLSGGCTFDNTLVTVTSQAELTDVSNGTFKNRSGAGESAILITGNQGGTWTEKDLTVSNNTYDIEYTGTTDFSIQSAATLTVNNSSSGTLTIITPTADLTLTSDQSSTLLQIFTTTTQTILDSTTGASLVYTHSSETVDVVAQKAGYLPQRQTGIALSGDQTVAFVMVSDPVYDSSHGLSYTTDASWSRTNNELTVPTFGPSVRGVYSLMIDSFIAETTLRNTAFNLQAVGSNALFLTEDAEGDADSSIENMTAGGVRYVDTSGGTTAEWSGIESIGTATGFQGEYQQQDGSGTTDARATGSFDELIKTYGDATHGNFDYRSHLTLKYQVNGYREVFVDVIDTYGISTLEPTLYLVAMEPVAISASTGDPGLTITITDHGASPVSWNGKDFAITITDNATPSTAENILRELNYNLAQDATYQGKDPYNWPEMVKELGDDFDTIYGYTQGAQSSTLKGVRVVQSDGTTAHAGFARFQSDDGTYYTPPTVAQVSAPNLTAGRIQIYNTTAAALSAWQASTAYSVGDRVLATTGAGTDLGDGTFFVCTVAGTSNGSEPTWDVAADGNTTTDNTVTWEVRPIEFDNDTTTSGYSNSWTDGEHFTSGDTIRLRWVDEDELEIAANGVATAAGTTTFLDTPEDDTVYDGYAIDGSTVTEYSADYPNVQVDLADPDNVFYIDRFYAWWKYNLTLEDGIRNFFGAVTATNASNILINNSILDIYFDNTQSGSARQGDNILISRSDGAYPQVTTTSGGGGLGFYFSGIGYTVETGVSGLTAQESADLATIGTVDTNVDAVLLDTGITLPAQIAALNDLSAAQVNTECDTAISDAALATAANLATVDTNVDAVKAKTDQLTFTKANELDANIQSVNDVTVAGTGADGDEWGP
ncbi:hypothetical protein OAF54_01660 [bacterium]|nr:hypothetical protein [bacterium]